MRSGDRDLAWPFAEQALTAAAAMAQASEAMLARAQLARLALARGDARDARSLAGELDAGLAAGPWAASARARAAARAVLIDLEGGRPDTHAPVVSRGP